MGLKARVTSGSVEPGTYPAVLDSVEAKTSQAFGDFWAWNFLIGDTPVGGATTPKLGANTKARRWTEAIVGRPLELDEEVDYGKLEGRSCLVVIELNDKGYSKVAEVLAPIRQSTAPVRSSSDEDEGLPF